jgi:hypothetical protein
MTERTFKHINGKLKLSIPDSLQDVTLDMMIHFQQPALSDLAAISALTQTPIEQLYGISDIAALNEAILPFAQSLQHQLAYTYEAGALPAQVKLRYPGGKIQTITIGNDAGFYAYGAVMEARELMSTEIMRHQQTYGDSWREHLNPDLRTCGLILTHFLYNRAYPGHVPSAIDIQQFFDVVKWLPITDAAPLARHFFLSYPNLPLRKQTRWQRLQRLWKNVPALIRLRPLATLIR